MAGGVSLNIISAEAMPTVLCCGYGRRDSQVRYPNTLENAVSSTHILSPPTPVPDNAWNQIMGRY